MTVPTVVLEGRLVTLEPLRPEHAEQLARAAEEDPSLYGLSHVPQGVESMRAYIETANAWMGQGTALPFAIVGRRDHAAVGSTRFFDLQYWPWPKDHPNAQRTTPDVGEVGYSWLGRSSIRTGFNTESKYLLLTHAFETWRVARICFHTDVRNERSRAALQRIGARFEGVLRAHRLSPDLTARDSARFSVTAEEWPGVKSHLETLRGRYDVR